MQLIIGITGPIASGKGILADRFKSRGFVYFSLSDEVRKEAIKKGLPLKREVLQDIGDSLRLEFGNNVLAKRVAQSIEEIRSRSQVEKIVVDGFRNPGEIEWFKERYGMFTVGVIADDVIRIQRLLMRARESDPLKSLDSIRQVMQRDRGIGQAGYGLHVDACLALADMIVENNGTLKEFNGRIEGIMISLGIEEAFRTKEG